MAISGALIASIAFFTCTYSPNVQVMILLYGLLGGKRIGFKMIKIFFVRVSSLFHLVHFT